MVDADTAAFNMIISAFALPKGSEEEKKARTAAVQAATKNAIEVPFKVMELSYQSLEVIRAMVEKGNPNSVTDAGVGALCARSAVMGSFMNVRINAAGYTDKKFVEELVAKGYEIQKKTLEEESAIIKFVNEKIGI